MGEEGGAAPSLPPTLRLTASQKAEQRHPSSHSSAHTYFAIQRAGQRHKIGTGSQLCFTIVQNEMKLLFNSDFHAEFYSYSETA